METYLKVKPGNMVLHEAVPFGQQFTYHAGHPIELMLNDWYFKPLQRQLRAGDQIRLVRTDRIDGEDRAIQYAEVFVVSSSNENGVELLVLRETIDILSTYEFQVKQRTRGPDEIYSDGTWSAIDKGAKFGWWVVDKDKHPLVKNLSEERAVAIAHGHEALPVQTTEKPLKEPKKRRAAPPKAAAPK